MALILALSGLMPATLPAADAPLAPFHAEYDVSRNGSAMGKSEITLKPAHDGAWEFTTTTHGSKGLAGMVGAEITEVTRFRWRDGRPELIDSRYDQQVAWKSKHRHVTVDAERGTVHSEDEKHSGDLPFTPNLLDPHVTVLALAVDRARGQTEFAYDVADKQKVTKFNFRDAGSEDVTTPSGHYRTERIERVRAKNPGRTTTSWLAPELGYMPVRLLQREPDGEEIEMRLTKIW